MKKILKNSIQLIAGKFVAFIFRFKTTRYLSSRVTEEVMTTSQVITHKGVCLKLAIPNELCKYRADSFSYKEPDTLNWIDSFPENSVVWDIGANVGLYSCYAGKSKNCRVFAFEPSVFNLELLARNIFLNDLQQNVTIIPVALNNTIGFNQFRLTSTGWGGALSSFAHNVNDSGEKLKSIFEYQTLGMTLDDALDIFKIPHPSYIKLDVDGIEHLILSGGIRVLQQATEVLVELPGTWREQTDTASNILVKAGLKLIQNHTYDPIANPNASANQIWRR